MKPPNSGEIEVNRAEIVDKIDYLGNTQRPHDEIAQNHQSIHQFLPHFKLKLI